MSNDDSDSDIEFSNYNINMTDAEKYDYKLDLINNIHENNPNLFDNFLQNKYFFYFNVLL